MARTPVDSESSAGSTKDDNTRFKETPFGNDETPVGVRTPFPETRRELNLIKEKQIYDFRISRSLMDLCFTIFRVRDYRELFEFLDDSTIWEVNDILAIRDERLNNLQADSHILEQLRILREWGLYILESEGIKRVDWTNRAKINRETFDEFRIGPNYGCSDNVMHKSRTPKDPVSEFRKGIKRDKAHYRELRNKKGWDEWKRITIPTIHSHGCENVIDSEYVPKTTQEIDLFKEQQNFMYSVFVDILMTSIERHYVRLHEKNRDAQKV